MIGCQGRIRYTYAERSLGRRNCGTTHFPAKAIVSGEMKVTG
jgi:hypothetical protein